VRILLVGSGVQPIPPPGYGGVERTLAEYAAALRAHGAEPIVLNRVRGGRSRDEYWFALELRKLLRAERFDALHASTPVVANRLAGLGYRFVYTTHSRHWFSARGARERWGFWLERRAVRRAAATVALTAELARRIGETVGGRRVGPLETIPIGVDSESFRPDLARRNGTVALGVGVVAPFKRWELAARALRSSGLRLRIAGPTPDALYARQVVGAGDAVELLGELTDAELRREYAGADLLVHPSRVEILAGAVLQAYAAALPVLGGPAIAPLVREGETGFAAREDHDEAGFVRFLSEHARRLAQDPELRVRMGAAARREAETRYAWPSVVEQHLALYRKVFAASAGA
jgi:glycosyltransferase involved in cell wall biosynthesis